MVIAMDGDLSFRDRLDPSLDLIFPAFDARRNDTIAMVRRCRSVLRRVAPDLLVTTNWGAIEWAIARIGLNLPHVHIEDGLGPDELDGQFSRRVWTRRLVLRRSTVVVPSHGLARMAREDWHISSTRLRLIPNGVDTTRFSPSDRQLADRRLGGVPVIGTVAALRPEKNISRLLQAFQIVRAQIDARLIIAGDGPERPVLEALAATLGISADVRFTGHLTRPETVFAGFDIFAISSDTEQMPLSVLEAMASGLPVVATNTGDIRLMVAPENLPFVVVPNSGTLAEAGTLPDSESFADALLHLSRDPELRHTIGAANRTRAVRDFAREAMLKGWAEVYDSAPTRPQSAE